MRVLGVDPGLTRCGIGVVDSAGGRRLSLVHVGVVRTASELPLERRLLLLEQGVEEAVETWKPDRVSIERVFSQHNVRTAMGTAQAGAVAVLVAARRNLSVSWRTPTEVKAAVTGSGRADKAQVTSMVMRLLGVAEPIKPADAADALALAITDIWRWDGEHRRARALAGVAVPSTMGGAGR
jgi:crossover junction endodeoxyribonuclease RuvC